MKKLLLLMSLGLFLSCSNVQHSDYERNLEITKEWFDTFGNEDLEATMSYFADEIEYQSALHFLKLSLKSFKCLLLSHPLFALVMLQLRAIEKN